MEKIKNLLPLANMIALVVVIVILVGGNSQSVSTENVGGGTRFPNGLSTDSTSPSAGQVRTTSLTVTGDSTLTGDATVSGGTLNVTTSNTATSTVIGGCFQFYATSTATALKYQASTTPGIMYSQYGTCPNL